MIKLLTPQDFALWKAIRLEAVADRSDAFGETLEETSLKTDEQWMEGLKLNHVFVYLHEGRPVGVAGYYVTRASKRRHRGWIFTMYVNPGFRGKGITGWLLGAMDYHARDQKVEQLHLEVSISNEPALRCYERNGFKVYATEPRALKVDGNYIDGYFMVKYL